MFYHLWTPIQMFQLFFVFMLDYIIIMKWQLTTTLLNIISRALSLGCSWATYAYGLIIIFIILVLVKYN